MKPISSRYFMQLFRNGLIFGLIPAMIIGFFLYRYADRNITQRVEETTQQSRQQIQLRMEQTLQMQDRQLFHFLMDPATIELMDYSFEPSKYKTVAQVRDGLGKLLIYDLGISDSVLISVENDWVLDISGISRLSTNPGREFYRGVTENSSNMTWQADFVAKQDPMLLSFSRWMLPQTIKLVRSYPVHGDNARGYASLSVPISYYSDLLRSDEQALDILVVDSAGNVLVDKSGKSAGMHLGDTPFSTALEIPQDSLEGLFYDSGALLYSYAESGYNGWSYLYIMDMETVRQDANVLRNITLGVGLLVVIGVIAVAFMSARIIYRPVDTLYTKLAPVQGEHKAGRDEFAVMGKRLEALFSRSEHLEERVMRDSQLGRELLVHKLLNGEIPKQELEEKLGRYSVPPCPEECYVVLMQMESLLDTPYDQEDRDWLTIGLSNICSELMSDFLCLPVVADGGNIVMVLGAFKDATSFKPRIGEYLEKLLHAVETHMHLDVTVCVSASSDGYLELSERYMQAKEMFKYQMGYSQNGLLFADDMEEPLIVHPPFPSHLEENVLASLRLMDSGGTDQALHIFISAVLDNEASRRSCYLTFSRLLVDIISLAQEYDLEKSWSDYARGDAFEELFAMKSGKQIYDWFKTNYIDPLMALMRQRISQREVKLYLAMKQIAETRYEEELSVEDCAGQLGTNASYLRRIFKNGMGMGFSSYLTECRMRAAKEMLLETNMRVSDIAVKLTYQNSQNFIRTFRKQESMTPGEYRKRVRNM